MLRNSILAAVVALGGLGFAGAASAAPVSVKATVDLSAPVQTVGWSKRVVVKEYYRPAPRVIYRPAPRVVVREVYRPAPRVVVREVYRPVYRPAPRVVVKTTIRPRW